MPTSLGPEKEICARSTLESSISLSEEVARNEVPLIDDVVDAVTRYHFYSLAQGGDFQPDVMLVILVPVRSQVQLPGQVISAIFKPADKLAILVQLK